MTAVVLVRGLQGERHCVNVELPRMPTMRRIVCLITDEELADDEAIRLARGAFALRPGQMEMELGE